MAGVFDVLSRADLPASVLCTAGTALPKVKLESEVVVAGTQVEQEERVTRLLLAWGALFLWLRMIRCKPRG